MEVWELKLYFYPSAGGFKRKKKKKIPWKCELPYSTRKCVLEWFHFGWSGVDY